MRQHGDWEAWLDFFAEGVQAGAAQVVTTANALLALVNADRERIAGLGRVATTVLAVHQALQRQPIATAGALARATQLTHATINKALVHLEKLGIVGRLNERRRGRVFSYRAYVDLLSQELAPV